MIVYLCDWLQTVEIRRTKRTFWERVMGGDFLRHHQVEIVITPIKDIYAIGDSVFMHPSMFDEWKHNKRDENIVLYRESGRQSGTTTAMVHRLVESLMVDHDISRAVLEAHTHAYACELLDKIMTYAKQRGYPVSRIMQSEIYLDKKRVFVGRPGQPHQFSGVRRYTDHFEEGIR